MKAMFALIDGVILNLQALLSIKGIFSPLPCSSKQDEITHPLLPLFPVTLDSRFIIERIFTF